MAERLSSNLGSGSWGGVGWQGAGEGAGVEGARVYAGVEVRSGCHLVPLDKEDPLVPERAGPVSVDLWVTATTREAIKTKYAIYAHGPMTGSGPSVVNEQLVASPWPGELAKGPPSSLLPYSANVKLTARLSALAVRKITNRNEHKHFKKARTRTNSLTSG